MIIVGTNSWVTIIEADAYFDDRFGASAWAGFSEPVKSELLISAYRWIQQQSMFTISASASAEKIKQAQYETAWFIYNYFSKYEERRALFASGVRKFKIEQFEEELEEVGFPKFISDLLSDSITKGSGTFPTVKRTF